MQSLIPKTAWRTEHSDKLKDLDELSRVSENSKPVVKSLSEGII